MKSNSVIFFLLVSLNGIAQNVGIGNPNPAEKLDVTGNINVTGTIKANGTDGKPNQVLMKNNTGELEWGDMCEFKNFLTYYSNGTFTVPAGVTKIMVELWGGGGGGNWYCGGGGGGYVKIQLAVLPGNAATVQIGSGGNAANAATAPDGGDTNFTLGSNVYAAFGGGGAEYVASSRYNPGLGGTGVPSATPKSYLLVPGAAGGIQTKRYGQNSPTTFFEVTNGGDGGATYKFPTSGGNAPQNISNITASSTVMTNGANPNGQLPGGGGASGLISLGASVAAGKGASGMAIVYY